MHEVPLTQIKGSYLDDFVVRLAGRRGYEGSESSIHRTAETQHVNHSKVDQHRVQERTE